MDEHPRSWWWARPAGTWSTTTREAGGSVAGPRTRRSALARLGLRVGALVVADELGSTSRELDMIRDAGVDVRVVPGSRGPIFINIETPTGRIQQTPQVSDPVDPGRSRRPGGTPAAWMFAPVAAEVRDEWADVPPPGRARGARLAGPAARAPGRRARPPPAARAVARGPTRRT